MSHVKRLVLGTYVCNVCKRTRRETLRYFQALDQALREKGIADCDICPTCREENHGQAD